MQLEPGLFEQKTKKKNAPKNLKEVKKAAAAGAIASNQTPQKRKRANSGISDEDNFEGYRLPLFNKDRTK